MHTPSPNTPGAVPVTPPRAVVLASLVPLSELEATPFLVDTRRQYEVCRAWADGNGFAIASTIETNSVPADTPALWMDVNEGAEAFLCAGEPVLERALRSAADFRRRCAERGVRVVTVDGPQVTYTSEMKAAVHRRLSLPTAGYDGC